MADRGPSLPQRLRESGPKRLLALDGGGIRGLITLGYLQRIEEILRRRHGDPYLVLSDYFDLIGGTSTGSIIATLLALGRPVADIRKMYQTLGQQAFRLRSTWMGAVGRLLGAKFDEQALAALLHSEAGERTLGSEDLRVGLMVVAKRADTGSAWVLLNVPGHRFYDLNKHLLLWQVLRASSAAPTYFRPEWISDVGAGERAVFVDGGVSMHNNPALQLLMAATLSGFGLGWPLGEEQLLLCSVGTGDYDARASQEAMEGFSNLHWLGLLTVQLMHDASELGQTILQWISASPTARPIDRQIGDLGTDQLAGRPLLTYLRYNVDLERQALADLGLDYAEEQVAKLRQMSEVANAADLDRIGTAAAGQQVREEHFPGAFDRRGAPAIGTAPG
jgi:predicted acylesterase/phospholipase RssA